MQLNENNTTIHNFTLDSTIDLHQYLNNEDKGQNFYISTNKEGNIIVVLIQNTNSFQLLHYIYEKSQYTLIHEQEERKDNAIINLILNDEGNLLIIIYNEEKNVRYYKRARNQKWNKFAYEQYHFTFDYLFFRNLTPYQIKSTSYDLSIICALKGQNLVVKHFNLNKNQKIVQKSYVSGVQSCFICKQEQFIIIANDSQINFHTIKPQNFLKLIEKYDRVKQGKKRLEVYLRNQMMVQIQMEVDFSLNLYILSQNKMEIYKKQHNLKYALAASINLEDDASCIRNFRISSDTIFFFIYDQEYKTFSVKVFQLYSNQFVKNVILQWNSVINFQNDQGFVALSDTSFSVFKSN